VPADVNSTEFLDIKKHIDVEPGLGRTAAQQASYQIAALGVTLVVAIVGGLITGECCCFFCLAF
jgi:ammonium transporter Rh